MSDSPHPRQASPGPFQDDSLINNILPSYQMYQSTVSKKLTPEEENFTVDPPMYEMTPVSSAATTPFVTLLSIQSPVGTPGDATPAIDHFPFNDETFNEQSADLWENTILANVHKLPNLAKSDNAIAQGLDVGIHVTQEVCQKGVKPVLIDPSNLEFAQRDYIHGYVTIVNRTPHPVTFDMVYVVFEGTMVVLENKRGLIDTDKQSQVFKFLNMLDLFASWSYANIDRLVTDNGDPHDWCHGETDPYDNAALSLDLKRTFHPNVTYKRYFTFRVPEKLLDDSCEAHNLTRHTEVPPSLGVPRNMVSPSMLLANRDAQIRDLSFIDTSISYSVEARVIGRALEYNYKTSHDQYVIAQEAICPIRVIPKQSPEVYYNSSELLHGTTTFYKAFVDAVLEKIEFGRTLLKVPVSQREEIALSPVSSRDSGSNNKLRHLYDVAGTTINSSLQSKKQFSDDSYQCLIPFKKKSLTGGTKILGIVSLSTPKTQYHSLYVPPIKFRTGAVPPVSTFELNIPLELSYFIEGAASRATLPEIKSITPELTVLTIRSKKHYIPIEFNHEMCFRDQELDWKKKDLDNFDSIIIKQFKDYLAEITSQIQTVGNDLIKFESQLFKDVKALASLQTKYINLSVLENDVKFYARSENNSGLHNSIKTIPWELEHQENSVHTLYSKKFELKLNLNDCHLKGHENRTNKGFDHFTLVPDFQNCLMARMYYVKITAKLSSGDSLVVNVPLTIES
ncbi:BUL1-like protein [Suhomyces tanzawaensis NRRL Y-17324]|uniref:BUL1-like protein n=1 Tax=Suhomyces tanzawaensis NRRL Y-17324 TaxID=984487 RepID=A0A1E4SMN2_9ASCO|nr:BUL1-like protein [Suhomyces tanzawaensis NRRL Y-17324]ODV80789.1 BUL1-like protein [Suhomyces tanzawaensis NRRL Y-17324]